MRLRVGALDTVMGILPARNWRPSIGKFCLRSITSVKWMTSRNGRSTRIHLDMFQNQLRRLCIHSSHLYWLCNKISWKFLRKTIAITVLVTYLTIGTGFGFWDTITLTSVPQGRPLCVVRDFDTQIGGSRVRHLDIVIAKRKYHSGWSFHGIHQLVLASHESKLFWSRTKSWDVAGSHQTAEKNPNSSVRIVATWRLYECGCLLKRQVVGHVF